MKTRSKRVMAIVSVSAAVLLLLGLLAGCGARMAAPNALDGMDYATSSSAPWREESAPEMDFGGIALQNAVSHTNATGAFTSGGGGEKDDRFVIATANYTIQTKTYDAFTAALNADLKTMGGYTNSFDEWNYDSDRSANIVARVPAQKLDTFLESLEKNGTVINRSRDRADVTDEMIDTGSKKEALKNEETALLGILEKARTVEDIIRVQDRLSNVRADLEAYSRKLQSLQNQVSYSTVTIELREVNRITVPTQKFAALASSGFLGSLRDIGSGLRSFALWFIGAVPYLLILAVPVVGLVLILRRVRKNKRIKKAARNA